MTRRRYVQAQTLAAVLVGAVLQLGCATEQEVSSTTGSCTFSRDFEGERRVLSIEPSHELPVACMMTGLPAKTNATRKEAYLARELHRRLVELLFDETRLPYYQADLNALEANATFLCSPRPAAPDFCYIPQLIVTGDVPDVRAEITVANAPSRFVGSPLRFGLQPKVALSEQGQELVDAFLIAHEACWNADD